MKTFTGVCALALVVGACGSSNPFTTATDTDPGTGTSTGVVVPTLVANDLDSLSYNAATQTLTVNGITQDGVDVANNYRHIAASFLDGYETFTAQNDPLGRHATAFVASREGVQAGVVMTGGQFNRVFGGSFYDRTGTYDPPTVTENSGDVSYVGNYAGLVNGAGPVTDLLPVTGPTDNPDNPVQAGYVRGMVFVNVDYADMNVEGEIYDRVLRLNGGFAVLPDIILVETALADNGTFEGSTVEFEGILDRDIGSYGGVIGGPGANALAGGITLTEFSDDLEDEIEYGVFVLDLCTAASTDPVCPNTLAP